MNLDKRLSMQLRKSGENWFIQYTTRAGSTFSTEARADKKSKELPADVMQCIKAMILAGERSSNTVVIDRRISEIYHRALLKGKEQLRELEELLDQAG